MDGWLTIGTKLETKKFERQIEKLESDLEKLNYEYNALKKGGDFDGKTEELKKYRAEAEKVRNKLIQLREKQAEINKSGMSNVKQSVNDISNGTENILKKVARWGLAIFGVRSAYMFIRQSMSTLSQYNEKIGADIQYIRFALASSLQPLIEGIIQLVYKLLTYIGYIAKAWFGVNIFANASVKAFQKVNKGVKDTNKSAKQLQKTLAGFDEMNILQKTGETAQGGGGGGVALPTNDLSDLSNIEIPEWVQWIADHGEFVKNVVIGIGEAFLTWKLLKWTSDLGAFTTGLGLLNTLLVTGGIVAILIGISNAVQDVVKFIGDPSWSNFYSVIGDLSTALLGLSAILIGINTSNPLGWITLGISAIGLFVSALSSDEQQTLSTAEATKQLKDAKDKLQQSTNKYVSAFDNAKKSTDNLKKAEKELQKTLGDNTMTGEKLFASVLAGTKTVDNMTDAELKVYKAYLNNETAQKNLKEANDELKKSRVESIEKAQQETVAMFKQTGQYNEYFKAIIDGYKSKEISEASMLRTTAEIYSKLDDEAKKTFAQSLPDSIKKALESNERIVEVFGKTEVPLREISQNSKKTFETEVPNSVQKSINKVDALTKSIDNLRKKGNVKINVSTTTSSSSTGMATGGILKLASGAVINNPGSGVPLRSGVVGGEAGREGVLPLTDQQAMSQLGYEIGKNVVVNLTNLIEMNGRLINRELQQIRNEDEFATNGG